MFIILPIGLFFSLKRKKNTPLLQSIPPDIKVQIQKNKNTSVTNNNKIPIITEEPNIKDIIDIDMNGLTIMMKVGEKRKILLPGNATTGYAWRIVQMDGTSVQADSKWRYKPKFPYLMGSGGYFQQEFLAIEQGQTNVYFIYDPVADPQLGYYYYLQFDVHSE